MNPDHRENAGRKSLELSRRNLLELAGLTIGAAAFSSPPAFALNSAGQDKAVKPATSVMNPLSMYMSEAAIIRCPMKSPKKQSTTSWTQSRR